MGNQSVHLQTHWKDYKKESDLSLTVDLLVGTKMSGAYRNKIHWIISLLSEVMV